MAGHIINAAAASSIPMPSVDMLKAMQQTKHILEKRAKAGINLAFGDARQLRNNISAVDRISQLVKEFGRIN